MQRFQTDRLYVFPLGETHSFTDGGTTGGVANRRHAKRDPEGMASSITRWWLRTGETWGAAADATYERDGERFFADPYVFKHWVSFLRYHLGLTAASRIMCVAVLSGWRMFLGRPAQGIPSSARCVWNLASTLRA